MVVIRRDRQAGVHIEHTEIDLEVVVVFVYLGDHSLRHLKEFYVVGTDDTAVKGKGDRYPFHIEIKGSQDTLTLPDYLRPVVLVCLFRLIDSETGQVEHTSRDMLIVSKSLSLL